METVYKLLPYVILLIVVSLFVTFLLISILPTENRCKRYIIKHQNEIETLTGKIPSCTMKYYTDITVRQWGDGDSSYNVIFWGNRESWIWSFKLDKHFTIDIPYNRSKGKNVELDVKLMEIILK